MNSECGMRNAEVGMRNAEFRFQVSGVRCQKVIEDQVSRIKHRVSKHQTPILKYVTRKAHKEKELG